ncbi:AMP-binding protein [Streptomyces globisporus]|uniref:AMP-binding protein n=1 Tax=Streptomyces globisporus TaxID=1908 RepID=A0A927BPT0_STRGL|nr:AMP-binding protein [Streptomyces globisporus]
MTTTSHAATDPALALDTLLTPEERAAWRALNDQARSWPEGPALAHRLEEAAARRADEPAVQADDGTYTYRELHAEADRIAALLAEQGVTEGSTVAVATARRLGEYAALLAALKLNCAYLPLAADGPARRLEFMLADSAAAALVADAPRRPCSRRRGSAAVSRHGWWRGRAVPPPPAGPPVNPPRAAVGPRPSRGTGPRTSSTPRAAPAPRRA